MYLPFSLCVKFPSLVQVTDLVVAPGEAHCATCGEDGSVRVWSLHSFELLLQFQVLNQVMAEIPDWLLRIYIRYNLL